MKKKAHKQKAGLFARETTALLGVQGVNRVEQKGGYTDEQGWGRGITKQGKGSLQGAVCRWGNIQQRKLGRSLSAHSVKIYTWTKGRLFHASELHAGVGMGLCPSSMGLRLWGPDTHFLWSGLHSALSPFPCLAVGRCCSFHLALKENLPPGPGAVRSADGIQAPAIHLPAPHSSLAPT